MIGATAGISMPIFWLALLLVLMFSVYLPIFLFQVGWAPIFAPEPVTYFYTL